MRKIRQILAGLNGLYLHLIWWFEAVVSEFVQKIIAGEFGDEGVGE